MKIRTALQVIFLAVVPLAAVAEDLVCDHAVDVLAENSELRRLHAAFDGASERRIFSEVHYYDPADPHLTVGMGHWIDGNLQRLMTLIKADNEAWRALVNTWASVMSPSMWSQFQTDTGIKGTSSADLEAGIVKLFCVGASSSCIKDVHDRWTSARRDEFNQPTNWFRAGWKAVARLPSVAKIQANLWLETIVLPSESAAKLAGADSLGAVAVFASARSSATSISDAIGAKLKTVTAVPEPVAKRSGGSTAVMLADWKAVVAWAEYNRRKDGIRPRMKSIWNVYFAGSWGAMPKDMGAIEGLTYSGCSMARASIERTASFRPDRVAKCSEPPNAPTVAACLRP